MTRISSPPKSLLTFATMLLDHARVRDVGLIGFRLAAGLLDLGDHSLGFGLRAVIVHRDARAGGGERLEMAAPTSRPPPVTRATRPLKINHRIFLLL